MVWERQCLEDSEQKDDLIYLSLSDKGVYRTAPATPDLLNISSVIILRLKYNKVVK